MRVRLVVLSAASLGLSCLASNSASAAISCENLASQVLLSPGVTAATSVVVPAAGSTPAYCRVDLEEVPGTPVVKIRVGLPMTGWNGKIRNLGGGGCVGSVGSVTTAINTGYVGSATDTGHSGGCDPAVNPDHTLNLQFINDFIYRGVIDQVRWAKRVARMFYGVEPSRNYWDGCSTGGRQGLALAQKAPNELDGILAGAPAIHWTKFQTAQMWGQVAMKDIAGSVIPSAKLNQATSSAIAACDGNDGVVDGLIDDPRTCSFSATANICGAPTAPASNCLTATEAEAVDKIWDGPRNTKGKKIWFAPERGASLPSLNGTNPFGLGVTQFKWNTIDLDFDWRTVTLATYANIAQQGSINVGDLSNTQNPDLTKFRDSGAKLLMWHGMSDPLIMARGSIDYYRRASTVFGGFDNLKPWFRFFRAPGVGHCGGGGPTSSNLFNIMVDWVENGTAPDSILASQNLGGGVTRTRPLCPYPQTAVYNGSGSTDDAANFTCQGNIDTPALVAADMLTKYKAETQ